MISILRRMLSSWIMLAILALVLVAFIVTGIGDPFGGGAAPTTVAKVGDHEISATMLNDQFDRQMKLLRQDTPALTDEQAIKGGAMEGVLDRLIGAEALAITADRLGLATSKRQVDAEIAGIPAFRGPDNRFSESVFRQVLASQQLDEAEVRREIAGDIVRRQLLSLVESMSPTPKAIARPYALLQLESRKLALAAVPLQSFKVAAPTDAEAAAYYKANIARYTIPERRKISYALIDKDAVSDGIAVTDKALTDYYAAHVGDYAAEEQRTLSQVVVPSKADAEKIVGLVKGGKSFADAAKQVADYAPEDLGLGVQTRAQLSETVGKDVAAAAFAAKPGELTPPVQSSFGWHVLKVDAVKTRPARSLAEVHDEIEPLVRAQMAEDKMSDIVGKADDELADGANITEVAGDLGLKVQTLPPLTHDGKVFDQPDFSLDDRLRPLLDLGFKYDVDEDAAVEELSPGLYALFDVDAAVPPTPAPLAGVKEAVAAAMTTERQIKAASDVAAAIVAGAKDGKKLGDLLAAHHLPPVQSLEARRVQLAAHQGPIPPPIALGFALPEGAVRAIPQPAQGAIFIVDVEKVTPGKAEEAPAFISSLQSQLHTAATGEYAQSLVNAIIANVGVKRYPKAIADLKQRYLGGADNAS